MIRVVLDTNVLISGLLWPGIPARLLKLVDSRHLRLCLNEAMLAELADVLERKKFGGRLKAIGFDASELVSIITEKAMLFEDIELPRIVPSDPDDDHVVACAVAAKARYIVTGDSHLLNLSRYKNIRIFSPSTAFKLFQP